MILEVPAQVRPVLGHDCLSRRTNGRHHDRSASKQARNVGQLGRGEGDHRIGTVGFGREVLARVRVPAGRQINAHHRGSRITLRAAYAPQLRGRASGEKTRSQDRINKKLRGVQKGSVLIEVGFLLDGYRSAKGRRSSMALGSPCSFGGVTQHQHGNSTAGFCQMARSYQAIPTVVSLAAQHHDAPALGQLAQNKPAYGAPGMLHQFQRRNAEALGRDPIGCPHLV